MVWNRISSLPLSSGSSEEINPPASRWWDDGFSAERGQGRLGGAEGGFRAGLRLRGGTEMCSVDKEGGVSHRSRSLCSCTPQELNRTCSGA